MHILCLAVPAFSQG